MKAVFVSYNQALTDPMQEILDDLGVRGFTKWELTMGRGSFDGEPRYRAERHQKFQAFHNGRLKSEFSCEGRTRRTSGLGSSTGGVR